MMLVIRHSFLRRFASMVAAISIAMIVSHYFALTHEYLVLVTTIFVMLTAVGNPIYQGVKRFLFIIVIVVILSFLLPPHRMVYERVYDVSLGAIIGILANLIVFPRRADSEFRAAMVPVLKTYQLYFDTIVDSVFNRNKNLMTKVATTQAILEYQLQQLPTWVYERGFDIHLKKGYQFFLLKAQHIAKILFAMHHAARYEFDKELLTMMRKPFYQCVEKISGFFNALITVFELQKLKEGVDDFEQQLHDLDKLFRDYLPANLELSEMSDDEVYFYELIYALNDLRTALIKLGQALR